MMIAQHYCKFISNRNRKMKNEKDRVSYRAKKMFFLEWEMMSANVNFGKLIGVTNNVNILSANIETGRAEDL